MKKVIMILLGFVLFVSGCAIKKSIVGESICKPLVLNADSA